MMRLLLAALLLATPALAQDRPDIDRAWEIIEATALDFSSTAEGYQARIWDGQTQGGWLYRHLFPEFEDPAYLGFEAAQSDGGEVSMLDCTRIGPKGLALKRDGARFDGFVDVDGDGMRSAADLDMEDDSLRVFASEARKRGAEEATVLFCRFDLAIQSEAGAVDYLVTRLAPDFETKGKSFMGTRLEARAPGPVGQILLMDLRTGLAEEGGKPRLLVTTFSRSAPGS